MTTRIFMCFNPYRMEDTYASYNLLYCFVADDQHVELVHPAGEPSPFGRSGEEHIQKNLDMYYKNDKPPATTEEWLKLAIGRTLTMGHLHNREFESFDVAKSVAQSLCDKASRARAFYAEHRINGFTPAPYGKEALGLTAAVESSKGCPAATKDIVLNLENRQTAIENAGYGPLNPSNPNEEFWQDKAERWKTTVEEARSSLCGNCAMFIITPRMKDCIASGLGNESGNSAWSSVDAGELGYCEAFDFKCASARTCNAWVTGGPITEEKE